MLRFLQFELQQDDAESSTIEAMASVRKADVEALETEAKWLLKQLPIWLGTPPAPLDDGGEWDVWVQAHWDGQQPQSIDHRAPDHWGNTPPPSDSSGWWTITVTLVVTAGLAPMLNAQLLD